MGLWSLLSTFWNVKMAKRSNWVPLLVTVKFKVIPAHEPAGPQSVGGLGMMFNIRKQTGELEYERVINNLRSI
jgi:hypothetical protein